MKFTNLILCIFCVITLNAQDLFLKSQEYFNRFRVAKNEKDSIITHLLSQKSINPKSFDVIFILNKERKTFEVFAKNKEDKKLTQIVSYPVCNTSGKLGPKRKEGDLQIPEGLYYLDRFNPMSNYYLSLGINYPNESDKKLSSFKDNLGGNIFIHGNCVTIGCVPLTDDIIKEVYLLSVYAKNSGQNQIPLYIFPFDMTDANVEGYLKNADYFAYKNELPEFWRNLKTAYQKFYSEKIILNYGFDNQGFYKVRE
jgi:murein L,D-transpeptidase YafK